MRRFFSFPHPVNDAAARSVAIGVVATSVLALLTNWAWLLLPLTYGFLARVLAGPKISPLGQFAVRVSGPRLVRWQKFVPGPPKRFAQGIGATLSTLATSLWLFDNWSDARWVLLPLIFAASLEGFFGYCLGCAIFSRLMRLGMIPESVCEECADITSRQPLSATSEP